MNHKDAERLRELIHQFIRKFGLLDQSHTPCHEPLPISQAYAFMELCNSSGITQKELANRLALSKSNTSRMLVNLEKQGKVMRIPDRRDGRARRLKLTEKGKRQANHINKQSLARFEKMLSSISEDMQEIVFTGLAVLIESIPTHISSLDNEKTPKRLD